MAKEGRREVPVKLMGENYLLVFNNAGIRATEDTLDIEQSEIIFKLNTGRVGARLMSGLFFGATRKYHRRAFPTLDSVDDFMDRLEDVEDEERQEEDAKNLSVAIMAAFTNANPTDIEAQLFAEDNAPDTPNGSESGGPKKAGKSAGGSS